VSTRGGYGPYLLVLPTLAVVVGLLLWPIMRMAELSFQDFGNRNLRGEPAEWVGADNYREILSDAVFWQSLRNTVLFAAVAVTATLVVGTMIGLLMNRLGRWMSGLVATGTLLAWATPPITAAIIFRWLFGETGGLVNWLLEVLPDALVGAGWSDYSWFSTPLPTYVVLTLTVVWMSVPFVAVTVLAGLRSLPGELYEAARVDGAGQWRVFWRITFPLLRPVFLVLLVLSIIWDFKVFVQLFVLAGGVANRDAFNVSLYAYAEAFGGTLGRFGLGSAAAMILTVILLIVTGVYVRMMVRQGETA
jgi:ABC-type sugar transport system permease subunit